MTIVIGQKPERIYKYSDFDIAKTIISDQTLKFSNPSDFNDPFDCDISIVDFKFENHIDKSILDEMEVFKKINKENPLINAKANDKSFWEQLYKGAQLEKVRSSKICCFSLAHDIILMWSHYSNKHKGVCLEFNNNSPNKFLNFADDDFSEGVVEYKAHERINYLAEDKVYANYKLFLNKSISWSDEKEYRYILLNNPDSIQKFYHNFLIAIYFGIKVPQQEIESFINICKLNGFQHLKYFKALKEDLAIKFEQINIQT